MNESCVNDLRTLQHKCLFCDRGRIWRCLETTSAARWRPPNRLQRHGDAWNTGAGRSRGRSDRCRVGLALEVHRRPATARLIRGGPSCRQTAEQLHHSRSESNEGKSERGQEVVRQQSKNTRRRGACWDSSCWNDKSPVTSGKAPPTHS